MRVCAVKNCQPTQGIKRTIFKFPVKQFTAEWLPFLGQPLYWEPKVNSGLCSLHYCPEDLRSNGKRLADGAQPFQSQVMNSRGDHSYAIQAENVAEEIKQLREKNEALRRKHKNTLRVKRRLVDKVESLESAIDQSIRKTGAIVDDTSMQNLLEKSSRLPAEFLKTYSKKLKTSTYNVQEYSEPMREFALTLHNISPKAYR